MLNNSEINEVYFVDIQIQLEELKNNIEIKQSQLQELEAAEALAAGPSGDEILPNITNGGMTYDDLRNSNSGDIPLGKWKLEAENYYGKPIENLSNQEIHDYKKQRKGDQSSSQSCPPLVLGCSFNLL